MSAERQYADGSLTYRVDDRRTAWRAVDTEGVVLDLDTSVYFGLNRSAGVLWPRLIAGSTHGDLVAALVNSVPAPPSRAQAATDISHFLEALETENLLRSQPAG